PSMRVMRRLLRGPVGSAGSCLVLASVFDAEFAGQGVAAKAEQLRGLLPVALSVLQGGIQQALLEARFQFSMHARMSLL
ncbi:MAG: hypothetical protein RIS14_1257, partial [Pseudomonadota bacterium]